MNNVEISDLKTPVFDDYTIDRAGEILRLTLAQLKQYELPASPLYYSLLFTYMSGASSQLNKKIEAAFKNKNGLSSADAKKLFLRYLYQCGDTIDDEIRQDLLAYSTQMMGAIVDISSKTTMTNMQLESHVEKMVKAKDSQDIDLIVAAVIESTQDFLSDSKQLEKYLVSSVDDIHKLKEELFTARRESLMDALTGLYNRKGFLLVLEKTIKTHNPPMTVIAVDIDYFAAINETHGHLAGDRVLAIVAKIFIQNIRGGDCIARCDTDRFSILLVDTPLTGAQKVAEKIRLSIQKLKIKRISTGVSIGVITASFGVVSYQENEIIEDFLNRSVKTMKQAKEQGRNRVVLG